jgi:hypothetical protein
MDSMQSPKQTDPRDVAIEAIKEAYQQVGHTDKLLPRVNEQVSKSERDAARHPSDQQKRLAVPGRRSSRGRLALQGLIGLLVAACIGAAAIALRSHGDAVKQMIAGWVPRPGLISSPAPENPVPTQPSPPVVQTAAATAAPPQPAPPAPSAQTAPEDAPTSAISSPGQAQPLQSMASDLAAVEQEIEQLKASIEQLKTSQEKMVRDNAELAEQLKAAQTQMARDNENAAEQLKASQEQMARLIAKASEQNLRPTTPAPPPRSIATPTRPIATPARQPAPKLSSPQVRARPLAPIQRGSAQQQLSSVPR